MNGFVVLIIRTFDDEPIGLFATRAEAVAFADRCWASGDDAHGGPKTRRGELGRPGVVSRVIGLDIVEFRDGRPVPGEKSLTPTP